MILPGKLWRRPAHPVIDLSPEKLADPDYMLGQFYIVDDNTEAGAAHLNAQDFLEEDFSIQKDTRTPQILIYHSHSQETFADSREGEEEDSIVGVGNYLAADPYRRLRISGGTCERRI